jgi:RHS repeat-associated protein
MPGGGYALLVTESDARGRLTREYVPYWSGGTQQGYRQLSYDLLNRVTADRLHAAGGAVQRQTTLSHTGLSSTLTDPRSQTTTSVVTGWGDPAQVVDAAGGQTRYRHDGFGQLTQVTDALNNVVLSIGYNVRGMKVSQADINMGSWSFQPNALGELTHIRDAKTAAPGWTTVIGYDALSRMTTRQDVAEGVTSTWTWGTNPAAREIGRLASLSGGGYAESYSYDSAGRLSGRVITADTSYTYSYAYNNLGALDTLTFPLSTASKRFKVKYGYDRGYPSQVREYTDNINGVLLWSLNAVDAGGRPLDEALGTANGVRVISGFDPVTGLIEYHQAGPGGNAAIQHFAYEWDAAGNLLKRADLNQSGNCSGPGYSAKLCESFGYDALERLISSQRNGAANLALQYDLIGNVTSKTSATDAQENVGSFDYQTPQAGCSYYGHSQRHAVRKAGSTVYCYDANGNMTSRGGSAVSFTSYNLPALINGAGASSQFWYTPERRRWKQVAQSPAGTETTIYVGGQLEKVTRSGGTEYRHTLAAGSVQVVVTRSSSGQAIRYLPSDHLGSVSAVIDQQGSVLAKLSFAAFGSRRGANWTGTPTSGETSQIEAATRAGYTGHDHLDNLALIHMHGRVYDPRIGRFLSRDPLVSDPGRGQDYNGYAYVRNGPLRYTDPTGWRVDEEIVVRAERVRKDYGPDPDFGMVFDLATFADVMSVRWDVSKAHFEVAWAIRPPRRARTQPAEIEEIVVTLRRPAAAQHASWLDWTLMTIDEYAEWFWPGYDFGVCLRAGSGCGMASMGHCRRRHGAWWEGRCGRGQGSRKVTRDQSVQRQVGSRSRRHAEEARIYSDGSGSRRGTGYVRKSRYWPWISHRRKSFPAKGTTRGSTSTTRSS